MSHAPISLPRNVHQKAFQRQLRPQSRNNRKMVLGILWGHHSQKGSPDGISTVLRRLWGPFLPELGRQRS